MVSALHLALPIALLGFCLLAVAEPLDEALKPLPAVPLQDPLQVDLGRRLFNETRLSVTDTLSCASCHRLATGGADNKAFSTGFNGLPVEVNTPSVFNASLSFLPYSNGRADTLQAQIHEVVQSPGEMGSNWDHVVQVLSADATYRNLFAGAFTDGVTIKNVEDALVAYERTLISANSRFDQYLLGDTAVLSREEKNGYQRFKDYGCIACHQGVNMGGNMFQKLGVMEDFVKAWGKPTEADLGRFLVTGDEADRNVFKVPSLRNVAVTAPYFHDASAATLEEAVDIMFKHQLGRVPSSEDKTLIIQFLKTLTGEWGGKPL